MATKDKIEYDNDGEEAREIAESMPYFPFKGIPRFYDISGFLSQPHIFQRIIDIFVARYEKMDVDVIAGYVYHSILVSLQYDTWKIFSHKNVL